MMNHIIQSLQNGAEEGIRVVNEAIDDAIYLDPEEQAEVMAEDAVQKEVDKENSYIDKVNAKIDDDVEKTKQKVDRINQSFDQGITKAKEKVKEVSQSNFMQMYRTARMVYWGKLATDYMKTNPDWLSDVKSFGNSMATKLKRFGVTDAIDEGPVQTETENICARRDAMFGSPDAGIEPDVMPTTEAILAGAEVPLDGLESFMLEAAM